MKVFDLHCSQEHVFEGWFASQQDFLQQMDRGLVECPVCGCKQLRKGLSAPRLNLGATKPANTAPARTPSHAVPAAAAPAVDPHKLQALQAAWLQASRKIAENTEDVGDKFADEALRMHHGEEPERPIRGQATPAQAQALVEEGVPLMPLLLPKVSKETLQ